MAVQTVADGKFTYLAQKLNPAAATITVTSNLWVTAGSIFIQNDLQTEWIRFTSNTASGSYWVLWGLTRDIDQVAIPIVSNSTGKTWLANQKCLLVYMHDQYFDASQGGTINWPVTFTGAVSITGSFTVPTFLNAAARDAAIPVPANGMEAYLITEGYFTDYQAGIWGQRSTGTSTPNASTTVAGKVEIATQSDFDSLTDTGWTGAILSVPPSIISTITWLPYIAWETLLQNDALYEEEACIYTLETSTTPNWVTTNMGDVAWNTRIEIARVIGNGVSSSNIKVFVKKVLAPVDNCTIRVETDDGTGKPSGTLADVNATASVAGGTITTSYVDTTFTWAWAFTLTAWTVYHIVAQRSAGVDAANYYQFWGYTMNVRAFTTNTYDGTVWRTPVTTKKIYFVFGWAYRRVLCKTSAANTNQISFIWFTKFAVSVGGNITLITSWVIKTFSGLTTYSTYYLSNTAGLISTSAWSTAVAVGATDWISTNLVVIPFSRGYQNNSGFTTVDTISIVNGTTYYKYFRCDRYMYIRYNTTSAGTYNSYMKNGVAFTLNTATLCVPGDVILITFGAISAGYPGTLTLEVSPITNFGFQY